LEYFGIDAGIVGDQTYRVSTVSVTTYDSACIHMPRLGNLFELIVFDECHHLPGEIRRDAARMSAARYRLGLTATYERADGRHHDIDQLIGPVAYQLSIPDVKGRSVAEYEVVRIPVYLEPSEQRRYDELAALITTFMADRRKVEPGFTWDKACAATQSDVAARRAFKAFMEKRSIEDRAQEKLRVLEDLFRLHVGEPVLVFAGSNAMARDVSLRFLVPCLLSHCGKRERLDALRGLEDGTYPALVANRVLDEGVDLPDVKVAIVIGGMASSRQAQQRLGRVLRKRGEQRAVLYEIVTATHGEIERSRRRRRSDAYQGTRHYKF
jgi:superfamily II DNA or RNA helicase